MEFNGIALEQVMVEGLEAVDGLLERVCPVEDIQKSTGPLVVFDQREESCIKVLRGSTGLMTAAYQVHVLHNPYIRMRELAERVKTALNSLEGYDQCPLLIETVNIELGSPDIRENRVQLYRRTYNVIFQYQIKEEYV